MGQCRFGRQIPWGEFYQLTGELQLDTVSDWIHIDESYTASIHYLFYFRDETFECSAESWKLIEL